MLTKQERDALDYAQEIIAANTPVGRASWYFWFHSKGMFSSSCYFDSSGGQHMLWDHISLADVVEAGIKHESEAENDEAKIKAERIAKLKMALRELGEEVA